MIMSDELDGLKSLALVVTRDERWLALGNRTLEQHHALIEQYVLHDGVPLNVIQHYENARNTWLYAFFSYRLLQVALMQLHVAGEAAIKERAKRDGINLTSKQANSLAKLFDIAIEQHWLLDMNFSAFFPASPVNKKAKTNDDAPQLVDAFREVRNALAHGEVILVPNLGCVFMTVRDLINQLFPAPAV
jgi:hypothetical protein